MRKASSLQRESHSVSSMFPIFEGTDQPRAVWGSEGGNAAQKDAAGRADGLYSCGSRQETWRRSRDGTPTWAGRVDTDGEQDLIRN